MFVSGSTLAVILACQTCATGDNAHAQILIDNSVNTSTTEFAAETALPARFGSGAMAPNVSSPGTPSVSNSFADPLYGARAPQRLDRAPAALEAGFRAISASAPQTSAGVGLDWSGADAIQSYKANRKAASLSTPLEADHNFSAELAFAAPREQTGLDFDVGIAPRLSVRQEGGFSARRLGAELRLGQNFDGRGEAPAKGWYMFAGADGEALVWETGSGEGVVDLGAAMKLRDQVTVGDVQAGLAVHRGGGQLSLSYIRREVEYRDRNGGFSEDENFAGVSFTLRR